MADKFKGPVKTETRPAERPSTSFTEGTKRGSSITLKLDTAFSQGSFKAGAVTGKGMHLDVTPFAMSRKPRSQHFAGGSEPPIKPIVIEIASASVDFAEFAPQDAGPVATPSTYRDHDDATAEMLRHDPELAIEMLNTVLEEGDQGELLVTLRQIAMANGMSRIAEITELNRSQLYRTLSGTGNPSLNNLIVILKAMGMRLSVRPLESAD